MTFQDVETARKTYWNSLKIGLLVSIVISVVIGVIFSTGYGLYFDGLSAALCAIAIGVIIFSLSAGVMIYLVREKAIAYRKAYKGYFVERNFHKIFTNLTYSHQYGLSPKVLKATGMINTGDTYRSNDLTMAEYKKVGFIHADAHIQTVRTDSEGHVHYDTIFKGRTMIFEFPKQFNFKLELVGKKFRAYSVPRKDGSTGRKMVKIDTESNEFNHAFRIFGQDGFETFYLLNPAMIVKILAIAERYKGRVLFGFLNNKMLVAIDDGKDSFEPPKWIARPIDEKTEMKKVSDEIKVITDLVDNLSLAPIFS